MTTEEQDKEVEFGLLLEATVFTVDNMLQEVDALAEDDQVDLPQIAHLLAQVKASVKGLREIERVLAQAGGARMTKGTVYLDGIGRVERHKSTGRSGWDHERILGLLLARSRDERQVNEKTGEYESEVSAFLRAIKEAAGIGYWRVDPLKRRGIDPNEFSKINTALPYITIQ